MTTINALLQTRTNVKAVNAAIVRVVADQYNLTVLPQRPEAVRSVLLREWMYWNDERGSMESADAPTTVQETIALLNRRAVKRAAAAVASNYRARAQFLYDQQQPLRVMEHATNESITGTQLPENRDIGIEPTLPSGQNSQFPIHRRPADAGEFGA